MQLSKIIRKHRKANGFSQETISERSGVSRERLIGIEKGRGKLSIEELESILSALSLKMQVISSDNVIL